MFAVKFNQKSPVVEFLCSWIEQTNANPTEKRTREQVLIELQQVSDSAELSHAIAKLPPLTHVWPDYTMIFNVNLPIVECIFDDDHPLGPRLL